MRQHANLDILRAFAVSTVLVDHLIPTIHVRAGFSNHFIQAFTTNIGHAGVLAFFVHTSLVLMYSLERMHAGLKKVTLRFYIRRVFRIYPLALFTIMFMLLLHLPSTSWGKATHMTPAVIISNVLMVQNIFTKQDVVGPLWSLPYEMQMYLVLPALFLLARAKRGVPYVAGLLVAAYALGLVLGHHTGHLNMAAYIPCFLSGVLCYALRNRIRAVVPAMLWPPVVLALISAYCVVNMHSGHTWLNEPPTFWSGWVFCLTLGLLINGFRDSRSAKGNFVANRVALYSYGIYLLHVPVLYFVFSKLGMKNLALAIPLFLALTLAAAMATFYTIESPCIELGRRLSTRDSRKPSKMQPVMPAP